MANIVMSNYNEIEIPTLIIQNRNFDNLGVIRNASDYNYKDNFNSANECSFTIYKNLEKDWDLVVDFKIIYIPEFKERYEVRVSISEDDSTAKNVTLKSLCEAELSQITLRDIEINTEENDILREDYDSNFPTVFFRPSETDADVEVYNDIWNDKLYAGYSIDEKKRIIRKSSLLNRLLDDKCPHYHIRHVDDTLKNIQRTFQISESSVYDELTGEISEEIGCLFKFDSMDRSVDVYDLYSTCVNCGYRGDYIDACPKCGNTRLIQPGIGEDTHIYIDKDNIASSITLETNADELKNCFYVSGGDDIVTSTISIVNPTNSNYIYRFSEETIADMPLSLATRVRNYNQDYEEYMNKKYYINSSYINKVNNYNDIVTEIKKIYKDVEFESDSKNYLKKIRIEDETKPYFKDYDELSTILYNTVELYSLLHDSMCPPIDLHGIPIEEAMENITDLFRVDYYEKRIDTTLSDTLKLIDDRLFDSDTSDDDCSDLVLPTISEFSQHLLIGFSYDLSIELLNPETATQSTVEKTILNIAKIGYGTNYYDISIDTNSYTKATKTKDGSWNGVITLTSKTNKVLRDDGTEEFQSLSKTFKVNVLKKQDGTGKEYVRYQQNQFQIAIAQSEKYSQRQITSFNISLSEFRNCIQQYSIVNLQELNDVFNRCFSLAMTETGDEKRDKELFGYYRLFFKRRMKLIEKQILIRTRQLNTINSFYLCDMESIINDNGTANDKTIIGSIIKNVKNALDLKRRMGIYYGTFCSYIREGSYNNSNYISDGKDNKEIVKLAKELLEVANRELIKASTPQYTLSSSLSNFLVIEEFKILLKRFHVGNWIKLAVDDKVYKLRLLSYGYSNGSADSMDVEFSTVQKIWSGYSDVQSVFNSVVSMATSYDSVKHQVDKSKISDKVVTNWLKDGFSATQTKYSSSNRQEILMDDSGILLRRRLDSIEEGFEPFQAKFISNGIYITSNNWQTIESALGRISYVHPKTKQEINTYGVIAKTIIGDLILGEQLGIYNDTANLSFDKNGLMVEGKNNTVKINPNDNNSVFSILKGSTKVLYTDNNGDLVMTGSITASSGQIGGWTIGNAIYGGTDESGYSIIQPPKDGDYTVFASGAKMVNGSIDYLNAPFRVNSIGKLFASNADIKGNITATSFIAYGNAEGNLLSKYTITTIDNNITIRPNYSEIEKLDYASLNVVAPELNPYLSINRISNVAGDKSYNVLNTTILGDKILFRNRKNTESSLSTIVTISTSMNKSFRASGSKDDGVNISKSLEINENIHAGNNIYIGQSEYQTVLNPDGKDYHMDGAKSIYVPWADGKMHPMIQRNSNGLGLAVGWEGDSNNTSVLNLKGKKIEMNGNEVSISNSSGTTSTSDERLKNSFKSLDEFDSVFMSLKPCAFKYNNGTSDRYHFGTKAQDVKSAFIDAGFTTKDFGGFVQMDNEDADEYDGIKDPMGLIYTEFTMWNTHMIQKAINLINSQQEEINRLKQLIEKDV